VIDLALQAGADILAALLGLAEVVGGFTLAVGGAFLLLWLFVWSIWRAMRKRVEACAALAATSLSLQPAAAPDQRMLLWEGTHREHDFWIATSATYEGPSGLMLDTAGPGFIDGRPRLSFARVNSVLVVARLVRPLPDPFKLSTMRSAEATLTTGDAGFDRHFKLSGEASAGVRRVFSGAPLRAALLDIYGPSRDPSGSGIMICANECGLMVYWDSPHKARTADFARAVAYAVERLSARRDFL